MLASLLTPMRMAHAVIPLIHDQLLPMLEAPFSFLVGMRTALYLRYLGGEGRNVEQNYIHLNVDAGRHNGAEKMTDEGNAGGEGGASLGAL